MSSVSVFCCLRGCLDGFKFNSTVPHIPRDNPIQLDTAFMGYEVVIVKGGQRVCGAGAALGNAPLVQSKSYFEVKVQQSGAWSVGLATRQTDLSLTQDARNNLRLFLASLGINYNQEFYTREQGGMDEFSWGLCHDHVIRHKKQELYKINISETADMGEISKIQEGDIIGVAYDHIQLKFFVNGTEIDHSVVNVKGTVFPALYVDDGAILDIILDNFNYTPPSGFEKIMLEQSLL